MLEDRTIEVWAYNLETVLAEKLETVVSRNVTNTRMRDFYDIYILQKLYGEQLQKQVLWTALVATAKKRGTLDLICRNWYAEQFPFSACRFQLSEYRWNEFLDTACYFDFGRN